MAFSDTDPHRSLRYFPFLSICLSLWPCWLVKPLHYQNGSTDVALPLSVSSPQPRSAWLCLSLKSDWECSANYMTSLRAIALCGRHQSLSCCYYDNAGSLYIIFIFVLISFVEGCLAKVFIRCVSDLVFSKFWQWMWNSWQVLKAHSCVHV